MSLIPRMLKRFSWCKQGARNLRRREVEVLRDAEYALDEDQR